MGLQSNPSSSYETRALFDCEDDSEPDLPSLADASDCDCDTSASSCGDSPSRGELGSSFIPSSPCCSSPNKQEERVESSSATVLTPLPSSSLRQIEEDANEQLRGCASLLCMSDLLSWGSEADCELDGSEGTSASKQQVTECVPSSDSMTHTPASPCLEQNNRKRAGSITSQNSIDSVMVQRIIEQNILHHMCCSEGYWRKDDHSLDQPLLCGYSEHVSTGTKHNANIPIQRIGNRNACMPKKARLRLMALRESGLGRDFSLTTVATYLHEEVAIAQKDRAGVIAMHTKPGNNMQTIRPSKSLDSTSQQKQTRGKALLSENKPASETGFIGGMLYDSSSTQKQTLVSVPSFDSVQSEVELFYDSDPGVEHKPSNKHNRPKNGRKQTICDNKGDRFRKAIVHSHKSPMRSFNLKYFNVNDSVLVTELIRDLGSGTYTFILHPALHKACQGKAISSPPLRTKAWFEMGSCLKTTLIQPKFVWRTIIPPSNQASRKEALKTIQAPKFVDLLNIIRIRLPSAESVDRDIYPFVKPQNSFILVINTKEEFLFEAKNEESMKRFVLCMKLMIARLASRIIMGDRSVFEEFFAPYKKSKEEVTSSGINASRNAAADLESEDLSVGSGHVNSMCSTLVAPVNTESGRNDELWGQ